MFCLVKQEEGGCKHREQKQQRSREIGLCGVDPHILITATPPAPASILSQT